MGPQYTSCVAAKDFSKINIALVVVLSVFFGAAGLAISFISFGLAALVISATIVHALHYVLDWMLNGKLICLHRTADGACRCDDADDRTVCAIGEVGDIEDVGEDKNPIEDVDNDYALDLVLAPVNHVQFAMNNESSSQFVNDFSKENVSAAATTNLVLAQGQPAQGYLLTGQSGVPSFVGYFRTFVMLLLTKEYHPWTELFGRDYQNLEATDYHKKWSDYLLEHAWEQPAIYSAPVLHCEFEGSRIVDMLNAIDAFSLGGGWCKKNFLFGFLCKVLLTLLAPFALANALRAWAAATSGSQADALVDDGTGEVKLRDMVVVRGRWAYDGGHAGYNEMHAVRTLQKVYNVPTAEKDFEDYRNRWCALLGEVPAATDPAGSLTPRQQGVQDNQQHPQNRWTFHPALDGCAPESDQSSEPTVH